VLWLSISLNVVMVLAACLLLLCLNLVCLEGRKRFCGVTLESGMATVVHAHQLSFVAKSLYCVERESRAAKYPLSQSS
jgi:hypothetical protein